MSRHGELYRVFQKPIRQNLDNDEKDIINIKTKLASLGRYHDPHKSGYIDSELDHGIRTYQRDRNLKTDGVIFPGGETEATILGEIIDPRRTQEDIKMAAAPAIALPVAKAGWPWIVRGVGALGAAVLGQEAWEKMSPSERQNEVDEAYESCYRAYKLEVDRCNEISEKIGKKEAERCFSDAAEELAKCQKEMER